MLLLSNVLIELVVLFSIFDICLICVFMVVCVSWKMLDGCIFCVLLVVVFGLGVEIVVVLDLVMMIVLFEVKFG